MSRAQLMFIFCRDTAIVIFRHTYLEGKLGLGYPVVCLVCPPRENDSNSTYDSKSLSAWAEILLMMPGMHSDAEYDTTHQAGLCRLPQIKKSPC